MSVYRLLVLFSVVLFVGCAPLLNGDFNGQEAAKPAGLVTPSHSDQSHSQASLPVEHESLGPPKTNGQVVACLPLQPSSESLTQEVQRELDNLQEQSDRKQGYSEVKTSSGFPIIINEQVKEQISFFQNQAKKSFRKCLARSTRYKGVMEDIFAEYGLPKDLIYLAMIESGFNSNAVSPAKATGMWQFMPQTARKYGLSITWYIDERRDPIKATHAAARYLKTLHDQFGCWYLALAAYNAGEGAIASAMNRDKADTFWDLCDSDYLKRETKNFVPRILAAAVIAKDPDRYGFSDIRHMRPYEYDEIAVDGAIGLKTLANSSDCSFAELIALNPELIKKVIPDQGREYILRLPKNTRGQALAALEHNVAPVMSRQDTMVKHTIRRGETLSSLARSYKTSAEEIARLNNINRPNDIQAGQTILVAVGSKNLRADESLQEEDKPSSDTGQTAVRKRIVHRVKVGDTLWLLSRKYGVAWKDLQKWNDIGRLHVLKPGEELTIFVKKDL